MFVLVITTLKMIFSIYGIKCHYGNISDDSSYSWMMEEFIRRPKPYLLLSATWSRWQDFKLKSETWRELLNYLEESIVEYTSNE